MSAADTFHVPGMHCGGCIAKIERHLGALTGVNGVRANLSRHTVRVEWRQGAEKDAVLSALDRLGFPATAATSAATEGQTSADEQQLVRCVAVAGFAAANVMLLSLSIWAGNAEDMVPETRTMFHWFSALIALPAIAYAGRPFFRTAWQALRRGRTNMDVPISLAVLLAPAVSLWETAAGGRHAYFDSAITLLFFLLIGRLLDRRARRQVSSAAARLAALQERAATRILPDGQREQIDAADLRPGDLVAVAAGEKFCVDGQVVSGASSVDESLLTGEALPRPVTAEDAVFAGTINQTGALTVSATAVRSDTVLAEIARLTESAEQRKSAYVALADRVSRLYAPVVHLLAAGAFAGWITVGHLGWQPAMMIAIAVLIITCPCALGLAVPVVQVVATGRLFRRGILVKSGDALERLAAVDTIVFDKTGTLTTGRPELVDREGLDAEILAAAASIAGASRHPLSAAIVSAAPSTPFKEGVREVHGRGLEWQGPDGPWCLGSQAWCGPRDAAIPADDDTAVWFSRPGHAPVAFRFRDTLRPDTHAVIRALKKAGYDIRLLSGDREGPVRAAAAAAGIATWQSQRSPAEKVAAIDALIHEGRTVLMVGDGLNDAPALAAATVSLSPGTAADIAQVSADIVFQGDALEPVPETLRVAKAAQRLVRQNLAFAIGYNVLAVPLAIAGVVTPMIAALCMSSSSVCVVLNALRLGRRRQRNGVRGSVA